MGTLFFITKTWPSSAHAYAWCKAKAITLWAHLVTFHSLPLCPTSYVTLTFSFVGFANNESFETILEVTNYSSEAKKILLTKSSKRILLAHRLSHYYYQYKDHRLILKYKYDNDEVGVSTHYVQIETMENEQFSYRNLIPLHLTNGVSYPRCFGLTWIQVLIWSLSCRAMSPT